MGNTEEGKEGDKGTEVKYKWKREGEALRYYTKEFRRYFYTCSLIRAATR
jgi:hypothetical protein